MEAQLVETALLAILTFQTSVASKASRVVGGRGPEWWSSSDRAVLTVWKPRGSRRARRAWPGCAATSNVEAGRRCSACRSPGTMAHSWVMAFDDEIEAFRAYMGLFGEQATLLIDTYDTAEGGSSRSWRPGLRPPAVRLDSGDLAEPLASGARDPRRRRTCATRASSCPATWTSIAIAALVVERRADRRVRRRHVDQRGQRRAGARRRLQAGGDGARRPRHADSEAQLGQAHVSRGASRCGVSAGRARPARRDWACPTRRCGKDGRCCRA